MRFIAPKRYVSGIDFLTARADNTTVSNPKDLKKDIYSNEEWEKIKEFLQEKDYNMIEDTWFVMDDILMTIEVCLDHLGHVAKDLQKDHRRKKIPFGGNGEFQEIKFPDNALAQVSLVSSAGMSVTAPSIVLMKDASIFLQDGLGSGTQVFTSKVDATAETSVEESELEGWEKFPVGSVHVYDDTTAKEKLQSLYTVYDDDRESFFPKINFYDPVPIPSIETRSKSGKTAKRALRRQEERGQ